MFTFLSRTNLLTFLAGLFFVFICYIIFCADTGQSVLFVKQVRHLPYGDKVCHFLLYGILAFLVNLAFNNKTVLIMRRPFLLGSIWVLFFAIAEEFTQLFLVHRSFELIDIICDVLGIALASVFVRRISLPRI